MKILWLAPNFNHYKARFLNHLAIQSNVELTILSGAGRDNLGDQELKQNWNFELLKVNVSKKDFGNSKLVKSELKTIISNFNWIMIPAEKKNLLLILYAVKLRRALPDVRLFSYNHPILKSKNGKITFLDRKLTKFYYKKFDRIIFYTQQSHDWAITNKLIDSKKAYWANNTIDNQEVHKYYNFCLPPSNHLSIVFIGRLIPSKRINDLIKYYKDLKLKFPSLQLEIIGDGPESNIIKSEIANGIKDLIWHGTLIEEYEIAPIMSRASIVFIPGHSGLSINHAFAYGRPYVTIKGPSHAPELAYIENDKNGYVLEGGFEDNSNKISKLLDDRELLVQFCKNANEMSNYLSVNNWVGQTVKAIEDES